MALDEDNDRRPSVISTRGRITIPAHRRRDVDLKPGSTLLVAEADGCLVFTPLRGRSGRKVPKSRSLAAGH